jgi:hypothetical protein
VTPLDVGIDDRAILADVTVIRVLQLTQPVNLPATGASAVNEDRIRPVLLRNLRNLGRSACRPRGWAAFRSHRRAPCLGCAARPLYQEPAAI